MTDNNRKEFPQEIFLKLETETNDSPYFVHYESASEIAEPDKSVEIGVYKFVRTANVTAPVSVEGGKVDE